jgi:hypothetical protein
MKSTMKVYRFLTGISLAAVLAGFASCQNPVGEVPAPGTEKTESSETGGSGLETGGTGYETPPGAGPVEKSGYPIKPSLVQAGKIGTDPIDAQGPWNFRENAGVFDMVALYNAGYLVRFDEPKTTFTYYTAKDFKTAVRKGSASVASGFSLPLEGVLFSGSVRSSIERSGMSANSSYMAGMNVRRVIWKAQITPRHPKELEQYYSSAFNWAIENESASKILAEFDPFIYLTSEHGLHVQATLISNSSSFSSDSSFDTAVGAGASVIGDILGGNFDASHSSSSSVSELSENCVFSYEIEGGNYKPVWQTMEQAVAGLPAVVETLEYYPDTPIGISSWYDSVPLWSLIAVKDPQLANEVFKLWISRAAAKAMELESSFGGYLETVKFESPGYNSVRLSLNSMDMLIAYAGSPSGGDRGDYRYTVKKNWFEEESGWNGGDPGEPGRAASILLQAGAKVNEDGGISISDKPVDLTLNITVGAGGRTGTNSAGTNKNGVGGKGSGGGETVVSVLTPEGELVLTVYGGAGGGYSPNPNAASISPADFPGLLEFRSSFGVGTNGGIVNGVKVGADSSCKPGKAIYQILRLN